MLLAGVTKNMGSWHSANLPQSGVIICERKGFGRVLSENGWCIWQVLFWFCLFASDSRARFRARLNCDGWNGSFPTAKLSFLSLTRVSVSCNVVLLNFCRDQICFANALKLLTKRKTDAEGKSVIPAECSNISVAVTAVNFTSCLQVVTLNPVPKCNACWQELTGWNISSGIMGLGTGEKRGYSRFLLLFLGFISCEFSF